MDLNSVPKNTKEKTIILFHQTSSGASDLT
jgi:hypothetical protein